MPHTFDTLRDLDTGELDELLAQGKAPDLASLVGWEFRGWNMSPVTSVLGIRKFKKGFYGDPSGGQAWGYNVQVHQNGADEPWIASPDDAHPTRYFFFEVLPAAQMGDSKHDHTLAVDYRGWPHYGANPVQYTVDYLVCGNDADPDLLIGKSYLQTGLVKPFLGFFLLERYNHTGLEEGEIGVLPRDVRRTVLAFAEAYIEGSLDASWAEEITRNVEKHFSLMAPERREALRLPLMAIEYGLPMELGRAGSFSELPVSERRELIDKYLRRPSEAHLLRPHLRDLGRVRRLFTAGYYVDEAVRDAIGYREPHERTRPDPPGPIPAVPPARPPRDVPQVDSPTSPAIVCDICVVGSGAAGGIVAHELARRYGPEGKRVILLEQGAYETDINHDEREMSAKLYLESGLAATHDNDVGILQGAMLGGSAAINNAICFPLYDNGLSAGRDVLQEWAQLTGAQIDRDALKASFAAVGQTLGIGPLADENVGPNGRLLLDGYEQLARADPAVAGWVHDKFDKNYDGCLGCGHCVYACPYGKKRTVVEGYIAPATHDHGLRVITRARATEIDFHGDRAAAVMCEHGDDRRTMRVNAREAVVVCAGAIGSSALLRRSGVKKNVGRGLSFNMGTPVFGRFDRTIDGFDGVQMATYVEGPAYQSAARIYAAPGGADYLLESLFYPPMAFSAALPGWFEKHFERMRAYRNFGCGGVLVPTLANGEVSGSGKVKYVLHEHDRERLLRGMVMQARIFFAAGAQTVYPATFQDVELDAATYAGHPDRIATRLHEVVRRADDLVLSSAHPQGGNAISGNPGDGAIDSEFRVHGRPNLFVCDASVFPSAIGINPQWTIMAVAHYFVNRLSLPGD